MTLAIDATNIADYGGGLTHLREVLQVASPSEYGFDKVVVIGPKKTLSKIAERPFLEKKSNWFLNNGYLARYFWILFMMKGFLRSLNTSLLFVPGGFFAGSFRPYVTMSQNMLPFDSRETDRYGRSIKKLKFKFLHFLQKKTFERARGLIFISQFAQDIIYKQLRNSVRHTVIYHGVSDRFKSTVRPQLALESYSMENPLKLLYVSVIDVYKHQWNVVEAIKELRAAGIPLELVLVGRPLEPAIRKLEESLVNTSGFVTYKKEIPFEVIESEYQSADIFLFASSCENCPNIVIEAMTAGLPILSSNRASMPEILKENAIYFDPEEVNSIKFAVNKALGDPQGRCERAQRAFSESQKYNWTDCSRKTFSFLRDIIEKN